MPTADGTPRTAEERLRRVEAITDTALTHLDFGELFHELLDRVREILDVDTVTVLLLDAAGANLVATASLGLEAEVRQGVQIPVGKGFAGRVAAEKRALTLDRVDETTTLSPLLSEVGLRTMLGTPLLVEGDVIGVLHVGSRSPRTFTDEEIELLQLVADRAALTTHTRVSTTERAAATAVQRSLLPSRLPKLIGIDLAARYVPGEHGSVAGDWYDVFTLPSGSLAIVIGDVAGHGLNAAIIMGRLRSVLRAYALDNADPAVVLDKLDAKVRHFEPEAMATVLYGVLDPSFERIHLASCGHLAPVLLAPGEKPSLVELPIDPPIGVQTDQHRHTTTVPLPPGSSLTLYTDGLVERRGTTIDVGLDRLLEAMAPLSAERLCTSLMSTLVGAETPTDDVALLVVHRLQRTELGPLELRVPAVPASLTEIRAAVRRWTAASDVPAEEVADLLLAIGEATTNVVEHAYGPGGGDIELRIELRGSDELVATVRDEGDWRTPRGENRGRGIPIIRGCSDHVDIEHSRGGTTVTIHRRVSLHPEAL